MAELRACRPRPPAACAWARCWPAVNRNSKALSERLDAVTHRIGQSIQSTTQQTGDNLNRLNERLAVIDAAQKNITDLASQVTSLQNVLPTSSSAAPSARAAWK